MLRFYLALVNTVIIVRRLVREGLEPVSLGRSPEALPLNASITYWRMP
jgi:hypothetical protein